MFLILILRLLLPYSLNLISLVKFISLKLENWIIKLAVYSLQSIWSHSHNHLLLFINITSFLLLCWITVHFGSAKSLEGLVLPARVNIIIEYIEDELNSWTLIHFISILDTRSFRHFIFVFKRNVRVTYISFIFIYLIILIVEHVLLILDKLRLRILKIRFLKILISLTSVRVVGVWN